MSAGGTPGEDKHPRTLLPAPDSPPEPPAGTQAEQGALVRLEDLLDRSPRTAEQSADAALVGVPAQSGRPTSGQEDTPTVQPGGAAAGDAVTGGARDEARYGERRGENGWNTAAAPGTLRSPAAPGPPRPIGGRIARVAGELMITAGVVVVLFLGYQLWITDIFASRSQDRIRHDLTTAWARQAPAVPEPGGPAADRRPAIPPVELGDGIAVLRVPRFGADYAPVVVEGVTTEVLRRGPGHFPGTAAPGGIGNFVLSGHRTTYGKPFSRVDELKVGDPIVVEVADRYFTYRVTGSEIVDPHRLDVTYPVPGRLGEMPTRSLMTLTTCHPRFSAKSRLIVFAELDETRDKSKGAPPVLTDR
ncbi:class E sortase [Parafrankia elaeagni]|uniref:class E sortase n=1 Tax=Parafrankia elaeagni TaxID=222534 RepID=UPI00035C0F0D|nr:class E sortase [Parafrankia elaeagni]